MSFSLSLPRASFDSAPVSGPAAPLSPVEKLADARRTRFVECNGFFHWLMRALLSVTRMYRFDISFIRRYHEPSRSRNIRVGPEGSLKSPVETFPLLVSLQLWSIYCAFSPTFLASILVFSFLTPPYFLYPPSSPSLRRSPESLLQTSIWQDPPNWKPRRATWSRYSSYFGGTVALKLARVWFLCFSGSQHYGMTSRIWSFLFELIVWIVGASFSFIVTFLGVIKNC